ncbi:MAG: DUF2834 domain-containing protein [Oceanococcus sp.]
MNITRQSLNRFYILIGVLAWIFTSLHLPGYLSSGFVGGTLLFWQDALINANAAGKFLSVDILFLALAVVTWMLMEAREKHIPWISAYILLGVLIGISLAVPLFLAARERSILRQQPDNDQVSLATSDLAWIFGLLIATSAATAMTFYSVN